MALTDSLVAYWKLDETSGNRSDSVGSNTLTNNNTVGSTTGKQSNAAHFIRANSESLSIADNTALSMGDIDFTIAYWIRLTDKPVDNDGNMAAVSKWNYNNSNREYSTGFNLANDAFHAAVSSNGSLQTHLFATGFGSPSTGTWYFVVVWHDSVANTLNISINNSTTESVPHTTGVFNGNAAFGLGAMHASSDLYLNGDLDEVGVWKRVLTADERTTLYNSGNGTTYPFTTFDDTQEVTDSATGVDSTTVTFIVEVTDSGENTDALQGVVTTSSTESATGSDEQSQIFMATSSDTAEGSDTSEGTFVVIATETASGADENSSSIVVTVVDTADIADVISGLYTTSTADSAAGTDDTARFIQFSIEDSGTALDSASIVLIDAPDLIYAISRMDGSISVRYAHSGQLSARLVDDRTIQLVIAF